MGFIWFYGQIIVFIWLLYLHNYIELQCYVHLWCLYFSPSHFKITTYFQSFSNSVQEQLLQAQQVGQNAGMMQSTSGLNLALGASNSNSNNNQDSNLSAASGSSMSSDKEVEVITRMAFYLFLHFKNLNCRFLLHFLTL